MIYHTIETRTRGGEQNSIPLQGPLDMALSFGLNGSLVLEWAPRQRFVSPSSFLETSYLVNLIILFGGHCKLLFASTLSMSLTVAVNKKTIKLGEGIVTWMIIKS